MLGKLPRSVTTPWASAYPDPITCGVDATINCTNSNGVKPPKLTVISSPVEIVASATMGVGATGSAWTVARAGGGTVVDVDELGAAVVGVAVVGAAVVDGAVVDGADEGPNESAQFSPGAQDLKLKPKKTPIICPGSGAVSTTTETMRCLLANWFNSGWVMVIVDSW